MTTATPRPRQVTFGSTLVIVGSLFVVLSAWERVSGLHTLEVQEQLQRSLSEPPASGLGIGIDTLQDVLRVASFVAAATAAASAILGGYALARSKGARLGLAALALPMLVAGITTAGLLAILVVVGIGMLWTAPASAWFAGRALPDPARPGAASPPAPRSDGGPAPSSAPPPPPPPSSGTAGAPTAVAAPPRTDDPPTPWTTRPPLHQIPDYTPRTPEPAPAPRPPALVWACIVTWVVSGLVALGLGLTALAVALADSAFFDQLREQEPTLDQSGYTDGEIKAAILVLTAVVVPWAVAAVVLAVLAFQRRNWARITLAVSAGLAGAMVLLATVSSPPVLIAAVPLVVTIVLLARPEVSAWFRRSRVRR